MASTDEIYGQVDLLVDAYGRTVRPDSRLYDAYEAALSDLDAGYIRRGVIGLLRDKLQFMPTPAEVRAHSLSAKDYDRQRESLADNRRLVCARCQDSGILWTVNRRWLAEHRDHFTPEWFAAGWLRAAAAYCRTEYREGILLYVVCGCKCRLSAVFMRQISRWKESQNDPSIKAPHPAFMNVYDNDLDCIIERSGEKETTAEQDFAAILLELQTDDTRTWQGNWTP